MVMVSCKQDDAGIEEAGSLMSLHAPGPRTKEQAGEAFSHMMGRRTRVSALAVLRYARHIKFLKIALPVVTVCLLVLIVAWPYLQDYESGFTLSFQDLSRSKELIRMENPRYVGMDSEGRRFVVSAKSALQNEFSQDEVDLDTLRALVTLKDNSEVLLTAPRGVYLPHQSLLKLEGGIRIVSDTGYQLTLDHAEYDLDKAIASSDEPVEGSAPFGKFTANSLQSNIDGRSFKLKGRVHVRIEPEKYGERTR